MSAVGGGLRRLFDMRHGQNWPSSVTPPSEMRKAGRRGHCGGKPHSHFSPRTHVLTITTSTMAKQKIMAAAACPDAMAVQHKWRRALEALLCYNSSSPHRILTMHHCRRADGVVTMSCGKSSNIHILPQVMSKIRGIALVRQGSPADRITDKSTR